MFVPTYFWNDVCIEECSCSFHHGFCDASRHTYAAVVYLVIRGAVCEIRHIQDKSVSLETPIRTLAGDSLCIFAVTHEQHQCQPGM